MTAEDANQLLMFVSTASVGIMFALGVLAGMHR